MSFTREAVAGSSRTYVINPLGQDPARCQVHDVDGERQNAITLRPSDLPDVSNDFVIRVQAACRACLAKRSLARSPSVRLSHASSAPSLACLTRDARYARVEAALRVALSRCDTEPSPLELQVRVMERGLHAWSTRAGRGYERVRKAEEALAAARLEGDSSEADARGSMNELQREKWMGIKERDEALEMVEKIKVLIAGLNADIKGGLKMQANYKLAPPSTIKTKTSDENVDPPISDDTGSKKVPILFSGRFPPPYLDNLPRSRRSVEPLRLAPGQPQVTSKHRRQRSSTLPSEPAENVPSTPSTTQPSTPPPTTPTDVPDGFGAALIFTPRPIKSTAQYVSEMAESKASDPGAGSKRSFGHTRLPSYVENLMDELSEDRIGTENFGLDVTFQASSHMTSPPRTPVPGQRATQSPAGTPSTRTPSKRRPRAFLGRPFSSPPSAPSLPPSPVQTPRPEEHRDPFATLRNPRDSVAFEKLLQNFSSANSASASSPSTSAPGSPARNSALLAPALVPQLRKSPSRMGGIVDNMRKGVKRVVRMGE